MQLSPYLFFDGNCAEAMRYYERVLGGKIEMMMSRGESPMAAEMVSCGGSPDHIMHARIVFPGGSAILASDAMSNQPYEKMKGFTLMQHYETAEEARRIFGALADGGTINMPMEKTFWAEAFGVVTDRFGTPWMVGGAMQK
jgi:PhnB protein